MCNTHLQPSLRSRYKSVDRLQSSCVRGAKQLTTRGTKELTTYSHYYTSCKHVPTKQPVRDVLPIPVAQHVCTTSANNTASDMDDSPNTKHALLEQWYPCFQRSSGTHQCSQLLSTAHQTYNSITQWHEGHTIIRIEFSITHALASWWHPQNCQNNDIIIPLRVKRSISPHNSWC